MVDEIEYLMDPFYCRTEELTSCFKIMKDYVYLLANNMSIINQQFYKAMVIDIGFQIIIDKGFSMLFHDVLLKIWAHHGAFSPPSAASATFYVQ